jgi:two-component sensor histidine kinase
MKLIGILFICLFVYHPPSFGQAPSLDSLEAMAFHGTTDSIKIEGLYKLCFSYLSIDPQKAVLYGEEALLLSNKVPNEILLAKVLNNLAQAYDLQRDFKKSRALLQKAIYLSIKENDEEGLGNAQNNMALSYYLEGQLDSSLFWHYRALETRTKIGNVLQIADTHNNIGILFSLTKAYKNALFHLNEALKIYVSHKDTNDLANIYSNVADVYQRQKKYDSAIHFLHLSINYAKFASSPNLLKNAYLNMGFCYNGMQDYNKALEYFKKIESYNNIEKDVTVYSYLLLGLSDAYLGLHNYALAISYAEQGIQLPSVGDNNKLELYSYYYKNLADAYEAQGNLSNALLYFKSYKSVTDSLRTEENIRNLNDLAAKYESKQKDQQIEILNKDNELKSLALKDKKNIIIFYSIGLIVLVFSLGSILLLYFNKEKLNHELAEKNKLITQSLADKEVLLKEIHHRVKNNLQVISSLLNLQSKTIQDENALIALKEARDRVKVMAIIHQNLYVEGNIAGIDMHEYIEKLINNLSSSYNIDEANIQLKMEVDPIQLEIDYLIPIGLILNELISNALKYAFKGRAKGTLEVTLHTWQNKLILQVKDDGIGMPNEIDFKHLSTMGYQLIDSFIKKLKAELYIDGTNGTTITLIIPNYHTKTAVYE